MLNKEIAFMILTWDINPLFDNKKEEIGSFDNKKEEIGSFDNKKEEIRSSVYEIGSYQYWTLIWLIIWSNYKIFYINCLHCFLNFNNYIWY